MAYKDPRELAVTIAQEEKWQPEYFHDVTKNHPQVEGTKLYSFSDGDYSGYARVFDEPNESNINKGRVSPSDFKIKFKGNPVEYTKEGDHSDFINKILAYLDAYGLDL